MERSHNKIVSRYICDNVLVKMGAKTVSKHHKDKSLTHSFSPCFKTYFFTMKNNSMRVIIKAKRPPTPTITKTTLKPPAAGGINVAVVVGGSDDKNNKTAFDGRRMQFISNKENNSDIRVLLNQESLLVLINAQNNEW